MNSFLIKEITDKLRLIKMDYDIMGDIETKEADEIFHHCFTLIEAIEVYQDDLREMESLTQKYHESIEEIDNRGQVILKQQKEIERITEESDQIILEKTDRINKLEEELEKLQRAFDILNKDNQKYYHLKFVLKDFLKEENENG